MLHFLLVLEVLSHGLFLQLSGILVSVDWFGSGVALGVRGNVHWIPWWAPSGRIWNVCGSPICDLMSVAPAPEGVLLPNKHLRAIGRIHRNGARGCRSEPTFWLG